MDSLQTTGKPLDHPDPRYWAEHTGPWVKFTPRAILRELARYANPLTGECFVSLERLADTLATTTRTIGTGITTLERAGSITTERSPNKVNHYRLVGIDAQWQPSEKLSPGQPAMPIDDFRLQTEKNLRDELANLKRQYASLTNGELPEITFFSPEEKKKETSDEKFVNQMIPSSSFVTPVPPSSGEKNVDEIAYDLHTPPLSFDFAFVRWAIRQYPDWMKAWEKCGGLAKAYDKYRNDWPKFTDVDLPRHRDSAEATDTPTPARHPAPMTFDCEDCSTAMSQTQTGPSLTDANVQVCGPCWRKAFDAHYPDATIAATRAAEQARHAGRAAVVAVGAWE